MHIVCPHCTTSYAINLATLGAAGRTVRCSRCKEVWLARPEDAVEAVAQVPAMAAAGQAAGEADAAAEWEAMAREETAEQHAPRRRQPLDLGRLAGRGRCTVTTDADWTTGSPRRRSTMTSERAKTLRACAQLFSLPPFPPIPMLRGASLTDGLRAMAALVLALLVWRNDVVRLLPQTAAFYKMVGLDVNLRGLAFKDLKITNETVDGKPVLVIEGMIVGESSKPVELPRLRFSVRDAQGAEIYAWNAVLEQTTLKPGERAWFKSRLASPPPEGRNIDVRFFSKRDLAGGHA